MIAFFSKEKRQARARSRKYRAMRREMETLIATETYVAERGKALEAEATEAGYGGLAMQVAAQVGYAKVTRDKRRGM